MAQDISEALQLIEKFLIILKEAGMLKSYYLNFCLAEIKNDHIFILSFQHFIENLKEIFFKIFDKWESLQDMQYKSSQLALTYESNNVYDKKSSEHCMVNNKDIDNVINSCSLSNHSRLNGGTEFEVSDSNELRHHLGNHEPVSSCTVLETVPLNQSCQESNQATRNNLELHNSFDESDADKNIAGNDSSLENVNFSGVYTHLDSENQPNMSSNSNVLNDVIRLQKDYVQVEDAAPQNQSCINSEANSILHNVLGLSTTFDPAESISKMNNTSIVDGGIMTEVITYTSTQLVNAHAQTDSSSEHVEYEEDPLENNVLPSEELLEENLNFSNANQSTVDTSVLNSSSSRFPSYYPSGKSSTSEEVQPQVFSSMNCTTVNEVEKKTNSCSYYKDISGLMNIKTEESVSKEHYQEQTVHGKKYFVCAHCSESFSRMENIKSHLAKIHEVHMKFTFSCEQCGKNFLQKSSLQLHVSSFHNGVKPFECHICLKRFSQKVVKDNHVAGHTGVYQYGCDECGKRFAAKNKLRFHLQTHSDPQFKCDLCNKMFTTKQYLQNHQKTHESTSPKDVQICEICSIFCANHAALLKHQRYKHRKVTFPCDSPGCNKSFVTRSTLQRHQDRLHNANKKMYECQKCSKSFSQEKSLRHHVKKKHTTGLSEEQARPYHCTICDKRYAFANKLKLHMMTHTQDPPHGCTLCNKAFYRLDSLKLHMSSKHFYTNPLGFSKSHACDVCGHSFSTKSSLKTHQALHNQSNEDVSSFSCIHCEKVFKSKSTLRYHLEKHKGIFGFECRFCSKKFVRRCYLEDHIQSHMTERSFKCNLCPASFKRNKHLRDHLRRVHPNHITVDSLLESITSESSDQQNLLPAIKEELRISLAAL